MDESIGNDIKTDFNLIDSVGLYMIYAFIDSQKNIKDKQELYLPELPKVP